MEKHKRKVIFWKFNPENRFIILKLFNLLRSVVLKLLNLVYFVTTKIEVFV